ncbi:MAG: FeoB-associated Cys-rich membrane protein [Tissierella sp.]|nr:FeoB-associated Cys-rich membrane protein [Tissierella sp.]
MTDIIIIGIVVLCVVASLLYLRKRRKLGQSGCGCSCDGCETSSCSDHD